MAFNEETGKIWYNGKFIPWKEATIHVCSHVVHYGTSLFEGDRCYKTPKGPAVFRLQDHIERLYNSCKIYRMEIPFTQDEFCEAILATVRENNFDECYIRPLVYRGYKSLGVNPFPCPIECVIAVWEWGAYLGPDALEQGIDVMVSTWNRAAPNTFPTMAKAGGNYLNSQLIKMEALTQGFSEGIALSSNNMVSEGSGENIFVVNKGKLLTPPLSSAVLPGITRDCVITLARDAGFEVEESEIPREMLYISDEVFFTGSAAEITPIRSIDKIQVGNGKRGPVAERLQKEYFAIINCEKPDTYGWLTFV